MSTLVDRIVGLAARLAMAAGVLVALSGIVLVPRNAIEAPGRAALLLGLGVLLAIASVWLVGRLSRATWTDRALHRIETWPVWPTILVGIASQVMLAFALAPVQGSDSASYLALARQLASGETYHAANGYAFWPPGFPFFLAPFVAVLSGDFAVLLAANVVLYVVVALAVFHMTASLAGRRGAMLALLLVTAWPCRLLLTTIASKELLALAMVAASLALATALRSDRPMARNAALAVVLGGTLGFAALTQPGLSLLFLVYPFAFWFHWKRFGPRRFVALALLVVIAYAAIVVPWMARNHRVFDGAFRNISTNGGSVFYRANNELATGEFTPVGQVDLWRLPELEHDAEGWRLGKAWIREHPGEFAKLAVHKLVYLLDNDLQGVYWAIERRGGLDHAASLAARTRGEETLVVVATIVSQAFWVLLLAAVAVRGWRACRAPMDVAARAAPFVYPLLYCCGVFAVFESGARQHIFAVSGLIALAASLRSRSA